MKNASPHISVIIPVFNEEESLPEVIHDLDHELIDRIIVVNNASTDHSREIALQLNCQVVDEEQRGYGRACLAGIAALDKNTDIVVFIDGDHSDHAEQLVDLIDPIIYQQADFVIGSRSLGKREKGAMTPQSFYGNKLACFLMGIFWGAKYTDLGPFRAITYKALCQIEMSDQDFGWTIEMQIRAIEEGLKIMEVPVNYRKRIGKSKISGTLRGTFLAGKKILSTIFKYKFLRKRANGSVQRFSNHAC